MPFRNFATIRRLLGAAILAALALSACMNGVGLGRPTTAPSLSPSLSATPSAVPSPESTPTPVPPAVIFNPGPSADASLVEALRGDVKELTGQAGLTVEERSALQPGDLDPGWKIVVGVSPDAGFANLASAAPKTQFVAVGAANLKPGPNLVVIAGQPEQQAFLAGFIAAVTTPDWRVGVLSRADQPADQAAALAFRNGARYLCGICNPLSPPYPGYPVSVEISGDADWQAGLTTLTQKGVNTVYLVPELQKAEILQGVVAAKMRFVSTAPEGIPDEMRSRMVAGIRLDLSQALKDAWPGLIAGPLQGKGQTDQPAITVSDVQSDLLTPGKMRLVDQIRLDLASGAIYPLNVEGK